MSEDCAKLIIRQFIAVVERVAQKCQYYFNKCDLKIVTRKYFDSLVIEVYLRCNKYSLTDIFVPTPLVVIDITDVQCRNLENPLWIAYLERNALILLLKLQELNPNIILPHFCCLKEDKCKPRNKCNHTFREEFELCCEKKEPCCEKPYNNWGKVCKEKKCWVWNDQDWNNSETDSDTDTSSQSNCSETHEQECGREHYDSDSSDDSNLCAENACHHDDTDDEQDVDDREHDDGFADIVHNHFALTLAPDVEKK